MKLVVKVKLLPTKEQADILRSTIEIINGAANRVSQLAWKIKLFHRFRLHSEFYRKIRNEFPISSQMVCLTNNRVASAYKLDKKTQRVFRRHAGIAYNYHVLSFNFMQSTASIWTVNGREKISFVCGEKQRSMLSNKIGESDLVLSKGRWFLNIVVDVPEEKQIEVIDCLGVDLGIVEIAYDSDGINYSGSHLNKVRNRNQSLRRKLQKKGTKSAKRLLKKWSGREANFSRNVNHIISKRIVQTAKRTNRAIAIERLTGIRLMDRARKRQRTRLHNWSFYQLNCFIAYKSRLSGIPLIQVPPYNTSKQCSQCGHIEKENRKSQSQFVCKSCGHTDNADRNGADNIRLRGLELLRTGALNHPNAEVINYGKVHDRIHLQAGLN